MTTVRMKVSIASADWSYQVDQVVELDDELAEKWIAVGHAEPVEAATRKAPEDSLSRRGKASKR